MKFRTVRVKEIIAFWNKLKRQIANRGGITYTELKALDVFEFFVNLVHYEEEVKAEIKANEKLAQKAKKKHS